jgi:hypothetical protein
MDIFLKFEGFGGRLSYMCHCLFIITVNLYLYMNWIGLDGPGIDLQWGRDFPHLSRPALGPTLPPVRWVSGLSRGVKSGRGVKKTPHPQLVPMVMKE